MYEKEHHIVCVREWLEGKISSEEMLDKMGGSDEVVMLLKSGEQAAKLKVPEKKSKEEIWSILVDKVKQEPETKVIPLHRRTWVLSVAASIVLLIGAFFVFKTVDTVSYKTSFGETASFRLPDNSIVTLNAGSALNFSKRTWKRTRSLSLQGEAFFQVQKGSNFEVKTRLGKVEVLGTSFNVRVNRGELIVACKTGKVRVTSKAETKQEITPGIKIKASKTGVVQEPIEVKTEDIDSWIDGREREFESWSLSDVFEELEKQFKVKVEFDGLETVDLDQRISAYITRGDIQGTLDVLVAVAGNLEYEIKNKRRVILRRPMTTRE